MQQKNERVCKSAVVTLLRSGNAGSYFNYAENITDQAQTTRMVSAENRSAHSTFGRHEPFRPEKSTPFSKFRKIQVYSEAQMAGHIVRRTEDRWTKRILGWISRDTSALAKTTHPMRGCIRANTCQLYTQICKPWDTTSGRRYIQHRLPPWRTIARKERNGRRADASTT